MTIQKKTPLISAEYAFNEIEKATQDAALTVKQCFETVNIDRYVNFLNTMYHYTRYTGNKAAQAAKNVTSNELKEFFLEFEEEEHWHYRLAENDLKAFGQKPSDIAPSVIKPFDDFWGSLGNKHYTGYLGALYVFENIAKHLQEDIPPFVKKLALSKKEASWLLVHAEEDLEHGRVVEEMLRKYISNNPALALASARQAAKLWENIMMYAFSPITDKMAA